jgi:hypothetical protein
VDASERLPPFGGFRLVFALVNGLIWFALAFGIATPVSFAMAASGHLTARALIAGVGIVAFYSCFFGTPGGLTGFLGLAHDRRFALPPEERRGRGGQLDAVWLHGLARGVALAVVAATLTWYLGKGGVAPGRARFCLVLGAAATGAGFLQALALSSARYLGDLRLSATTAQPTLGWLLLRVGVGQAAGNGAIAGLLAVATFPPTGAPATRMSLAGAIPDAAGSALVIALFMLFTAGGLVGLDRRLGRVAAVAGPSHGRGYRLVVAVAVAFAAAGLAAVAAWLFDGLPGTLFAVWKVLLGASVAGTLAVTAARWELATGQAAGDISGCDEGSLR